MKVVIVCGSLIFYKEMMEVSEKTELEGNRLLVLYIRRSFNT